LLKDNTTLTPSTIERAIGADPWKAMHAALRMTLRGLVAAKIQRKSLRDFP